MIIRDLLEAHADILRELAPIDGVQAAQTFAGLMLVPELQANHLRLQTLVYLSLYAAGGRETLSPAIVQRSFERIGSGWAGTMEDPSEDVFVTLVETDNGNFRLREGIYEASAFHVQRVLNVIATMPAGGVYRRIRRSVGALLKLSDSVVARAGLADNMLGGELPTAKLSPTIIDQLSELRRLVRFTAEELRALGLSHEDLADFEYDIEAVESIPEEAFFHTALQRRPILFRGEDAYFLMPIATGAAITRYAMEMMEETGQLAVFETRLVAEYAKLIQESPLLGQGPGASPFFQPIDGGSIASSMGEVDYGRFFQIIYFVEPLTGFIESSFSERYDLPELAVRAIEFHLGEASRGARGAGHFRQGITILVLCGVGRGAAMRALSGQTDDWTVEILSGFDFDALCWIPEFDALSLFRLINARRRLEQNGIVLVNSSGLLNLVAWMRHLNGHLVPHTQMPESFASEGLRLIDIDPFIIRDLRHDVLTTFDPRRVVTIDGRWERVRREARSLFNELRDSPLYFSIDAAENGRLRSVYVTEKHSYWVECYFPKGAARVSAFQHFEMLNAWVRRTAPIIDEKLAGLMPGPIELRVRFSEIVGNIWGDSPQSARSEIRSLFHVTTKDRVVEILVDAGFDDALRQPENVAERSLVEAMVTGIVRLANSEASADDQASIVSAICPNSQARTLHRFQARQYRDFIPANRLGKLVLVDEIDSASYRFGVGWKVRSKEDGGEIVGVNQCKDFLNALVAFILDELCAALRAFNRKKVIERLWRNHEAVECDRARWRRTASANIGIHDHREETIATIVRRESRLTAASMACRILLEAALCECQEIGGSEIGDLDLTRLMAMALIGYHWGGYSDVIYWGAAEPRLTITPLGDILTSVDFLDNIYEPFGRVGSERQVLRAAETYPELFRSVDASADAGPSAATAVGSEFDAAWQVEFGVSIDDLVEFFERVEIAGRERGNESVMFMSLDEAHQLISEVTDKSVNEASETLQPFMLVPRQGWRRAEPGFLDKDWFPWRFRRRYATVRAPFLCLSTGGGAELAFAPGFARQAFAMTVGLYYRAEIPQYQAKTSAMRNWLGARNHRHRLAFNTAVAERMSELGWQTKKETTVAALIGGGLERNYGDIDVVAWSPDSGRVLLIECKDMQYHRAMGEVAEQLHDFRGEILPDGKPDLLRKHLDRVAKVKTNPAAVAKALRIRVPVTIEGHLVFKNPVPMRFVADRLARKITVRLFDELDQL